MRRRLPPWAAALALMLIAGVWSPAGGATGSEALWYGTDAHGRPTVRLYFFWTETCPHCRRARPFVDGLVGKFPWLELASRPLGADRPDDVAFFLKMSRDLGEDSPGVPSFLFCGRMLVGFDRPETTGAALEQALVACHEQVTVPTGPASTGMPSLADPVAAALVLPLFGTIDQQSVSLPLLTVMIATVDAFNPCAFFVLMFLMSMLAHARKRGRMAVIGAIFVLTSGLLYFAFMAAWLNVFLVIGELRWVTVLAALIALGLAVINIKDYLWFGRGVSASIPETAKPGLYQRMRTLMLADNWPALLVGTVTLAIAANTYELLCTAGFPMLFTRLLTLRELPPSGHYLYLALYNLVYVVPLLGIATLFVITFGSRKLQAHEGRILKLLSGLMMLGLGLALLLRPEWLTDIGSAAAILLTAAVATALIVALAPGRAST